MSHKANTTGELKEAAREMAREKITDEIEEPLAELQEKRAELKRLRGELAELKEALVELREEG